MGGETPCPAKAASCPGACIPCPELGGGGLYIPGVRGPCPDTGGAGKACPEELGGGGAPKLVGGGPDIPCPELRGGGGPP